MSSLPVLVLNSGSSSIKFSVYEAGDGQRTKLTRARSTESARTTGKFWIKDASGKKLVDQTPALPNRAWLLHWLRTRCTPASSLLP